MLFNVHNFVLMCILVMEWIKNLLKFTYWTSLHTCKGLNSVNDMITCI